MMYMNHQVEQIVRELDAAAPKNGASQPKWTWIAGRRFRAQRRL